MLIQHVNKGFLNLFVRNLLTMLNSKEDIIY